MLFEDNLDLRGSFDFAFIDAVKRDYLKYLKLIEPKLKPGAVILTDKVIHSAGKCRLPQQLRSSPMTAFLMQETNCVVAVVYV